MNSWHVEDKHSGAGRAVEGSFDDAIRDAQSQCSRDWDKWVVWQQPANIRMAEVTSRGACWVKTKLSGEEVKTLMRRHHKTIAELSFQMGITQKRIRQVREKGLSDGNAVRDWIEATSEEDVGPLPERYRISGIQEEGDCNYCGCPLFNGEHAYEYGLAMHCSISCCRLARGWGKEQAA